MELSKKHRRQLKNIGYAPVSVGVSGVDNVQPWSGTTYSGRAGPLEPAWYIPAGTAAGSGTHLLSPPPPAGLGDTGEGEG